MKYIKLVGELYKVNKPKPNSDSDEEIVMSSKFKITIIMYSFYSHIFSSFQLFHKCQLLVCLH